MARGNKNGLDYTYLDCNFFDKEKVFRVENDPQFGEIGVCRTLKILLFLTETEGFWMEFNDTTPALVAKRVFGDSETEGYAKALLEKLIEVGFFVLVRDEEKNTDYLTSQGFFDEWKRTLSRSKREPDWERIPAVLISLFSQDEPKSAKRGRPAKFANINKENENICANISDKNENIPAVDKNRIEINKEINKEEVSFANKSEETETTPRISTDPILQARELPRWGPMREKIARRIFEPSLCADLVDAVTAALLLEWISDKKLERIINDARQARELHQRGNPAGKDTLWKTIRPEIEAVYRGRGAPFPVCDKTRKEPAPPPLKPAPPPWQRTGEQAGPRISYTELMNARRKAA